MNDLKRPTVDQTPSTDSEVLRVREFETVLLVEKERASIGTRGGTGLGTEGGAPPFNFRN